MPLSTLKSELLKDNLRLQQCAELDKFHIVPDSPFSAAVNLIQEALRRAALAAIPVTEKHFGFFTKDAIVKFKTEWKLFTKNTTTVDPIVGINTIAKLDELLVDQDKHRKEVPHREKYYFGRDVITPPILYTSECDLMGFSAARLFKPSDDDDWDFRSMLKPISQMVPLHQSRQLNVKPEIGWMSSVEMEDTRIASAEVVEQGKIIVKGNSAGITRLLISIRQEGAEIIDKLILSVVVRRRVTLTLNIVNLNYDPSEMVKAAISLNLLVDRLNRIFNTQANLFFQVGTITQIGTMKINGRLQKIDPAKRLIFQRESSFLQSNKQFFTEVDLQALVRDANAVTVFMAPNIYRDQNDEIFGMGFLGKRICWCRTNLASEIFIISHEIGHAIGLHHIMTNLEIAPPDKNHPDGRLNYPFSPQSYLMFPAATPWTQFVVPSETLVDLVV
jgi:hypothetical protein